MTRYNKLYIVGFMGSGKSTLGARLAGMLGWKFIDLDKCIEEAAGMSIPDIFASEGESSFRDIESRTLRAFGNAMHVVISTGGGTPCHEANMDFMISSGLTLYLEMTPGQLKSRVAGTGNIRPLIRNVAENELSGFIRDKLSQREEYYKLAHYTISGFDPDPAAVLDQIKTNLAV
jgi:shikimate kinase